MPATFAAVDLGASSGRVIAATVGPSTLELAEVRRFRNGPVRGADGLHWAIAGLYREVLSGLRSAAAGAEIAGLAVDSWAIDYGLIGGDGELLGDPFHYRDLRSIAAIAAVQQRVPADRLYSINGLQYLPFTTIYQLAAEPPSRLAAASTLLLIPGLIGYWLTGRRNAEVTNASTTGLLDVRTRQWSPRVLEALALRPGLLPEIVLPGTDLGPLLPAVLAQTGLPVGARLTAVGSHDTASAVVGVPASGPDFAYISCGTWALAGVELAAPLLDEPSRLANFSNEAGVDGTVRFLRNVMGLWILQGAVADWQRNGLPAELPGLLAAAAALPAGGPTFDVDHPDFLPPGDMLGRIAAACERAGQPAPGDPPATVRAILDSLARSMAATVHRAAELTGTEPTVIHLVGGGSRNILLCQLLSDAAGLPVLAGPVEATAIGNALIQARANGSLTGDLFALRDLVRRSQPIARYLPR